MPDYKQSVVDSMYLVDSGLLYLINRDILHPVGLALAVNKERALVIRDFRDNPEVAQFPREVVLSAYAKFRKFMDEFGNRQMDRREEKLGWAVQPQIYGEK